MSRYRVTIIVQIIALALLGCAAIIAGIYLFSTEDVGGAMILSGIGVTILVVAALAGVANGRS